MSKFVSMLLVLMLVFASVACLAEVERETVIAGYEYLDADSHAVYTETWEYTVVGGVRQSGHPVEEGFYVEAHTFDDDGVCVYCGYSQDDGDDSGKTTTTTTTTDTAEEVEAEAGAETEAETEETFTTASGITLTVGAPADVALKQVLAAIPANTEITISGVDPEVADALLKAINEGATAAELLEILADFPVQEINGVPCYIVTISYTDAAGNPVEESYAFSTADASLVSVF